MIYFDNAATGGRKPDCVVRAVRACIEGVCGNPGRSGARARPRLGGGGAALPPPAVQVFGQRERGAG